MNERIKLKRNELGLTQAQIAQKLGISERQYNRIENGASNGKKPLWLKLSQILNTTVDELLA
jgi:DNA-binding XRE family transcriptional regulator